MAKTEIIDGVMYRDGVRVEDWKEGQGVRMGGISIGSITARSSSGAKNSGAASDDRREQRQKAREARVQARDTARENRVGAQGVKIEGLRTTGDFQIIIDGQQVNLTEGSPGVTTNPDGSLNIEGTGDGVELYFGGKRK